MPYSFSSEQYKFLAYPKDKFFAIVLPFFIKCIFKINPIIFTGALFSVFIVKDNWKLIIIASLLFGAHLGTFVTGWTFHYGYMSAGIVIFTTLAFARLISMLINSNRYAKMLGYCLFAAAVLYFMSDIIPGIRWQYDNHHGGYKSINKPVTVYHGDEKSEY